MNWELDFLPEAVKDLMNLGGNQRLLVLKSIKKVQTNPLSTHEGGYGKPLGNKNGNHLSGFLKIKLRDAGIRVVYKLVRTETQMLTNPATSQKSGISLVIDFKNETFDLYGHEGVTASTPGSPVSYSVGIVHNYEKPGDYGGYFVNCGLTYDGIGLEYCRSPEMSPNSAEAVSITFGLKSFNSTNAYVGWDYYYQICTWGGG